MDGDELEHLAAFRSAVGERPRRGRLGVLLTKLDGADLGAIQLFDKHEGDFTEDDEAAAAHLAQMASAAVERARLYQDRQQSRSSQEGESELGPRHN